MKQKIKSQFFFATDVISAGNHFKKLKKTKNIIKKGGRICSIKEDKETKQHTHRHHTIH
jgi:hypothetical protein